MKVPTGADLALHLDAGVTAMKTDRPMFLLDRADLDAINTKLLKFDAVDAARQGCEKQIDDLALKLQQKGFWQTGWGIALTTLAIAALAGGAIGVGYAIPHN